MSIIVISVCALTFGRGTCKTLDRGACVISLRSKFDKMLLFWLLKIGVISEVEKMQLFLELIYIVFMGLFNSVEKPGEKKEIIFFWGVQT